MKTTNLKLLKFKISWSFLYNFTIRKDHFKSEVFFDLSKNVEKNGNSAGLDGLLLLAFAG